jgi:hypothetical protein
MFRPGARYTRLTTFFRPRHVKDQTHPKWQPPALRIVILLPTVLVCWGTIALLQVLLTRSQKEGGLAFAERREDFSLGTTFAHFYLPTVLAVVFSIHLAWIDLDVKRCESYFQLSRKDGALGRESLLLQYPFSFLPTVPVTALRRGYAISPSARLPN